MTAPLPAPLPGTPGTLRRTRDRLVLLSRLRRASSRLGAVALGLDHLHAVSHRGFGEYDPCGYESLAAGP